MWSAGRFVGSNLLRQSSRSLQNGEMLVCTSIYPFIVDLRAELDTCEPELPDGRILPVGTAVAVLGWAMHFDKGVYGPDALDFRPERWPKGEGEDDDEYTERLRRMNKADLTWGHGDRACMGKNIARCEMYKLMATLYSMFDVNLRRDHRCPKDRSLTMLTGTTRES